MSKYLYDVYYAENGIGDKLETFQHKKDALRLVKECLINFINDFDYTENESFYLESYNNGCGFTAFIHDRYGDTWDYTVVVNAVLDN